MIAPEAATKKGDRHHLCEGPARPLRQRKRGQAPFVRSTERPFRQMVLDPIVSGTIVVIGCEVGKRFFCGRFWKRGVIDFLAGRGGFSCQDGRADPAARDRGRFGSTSARTGSAAY